MKHLTILIILTALIGSQAHAQKGATYQLPAIDVVAEKAAEVSAKGPVPYGISTQIDDLKMQQGEIKQGTWVKTASNEWQWRLSVSAENATSLDFGFKNFYLPPSAELVIVSADKQVMKGPYDGSVNQKHGYFWPGTIPGSGAEITITVAEQFKKYLNFDLYDIPRGYFRFWEQPTTEKSLACNIDVNCEAGDPWENQINSVARYTFTSNNRTFFCSGQLINNTANDGTPYFLSGNHCGFEDASNTNQKEAIAASMNFWWNYQSRTCRTPGSGQSGVTISTAGFNDTQSGATYIANNAASDFVLVRLNQSPDSSFGTELTGWDRRASVPDSAFSIHHPRGHAKRIAFENSPLSLISPTPGVSNTHLQVFEWDEGLTEQGSSGGGLWTNEGLLVGQLHFGTLAQVCTDTVTDGYGRFFTSWDLGNNPQSRLKEWLDPINTGQETLQGTGGCEAPAVDIVNDSSNQVGDLLTFSALVSGGAGGYEYAWEINADEGIDGRDDDIQARYNQEYVGNIVLNVTDSAGCVGSASKAVVVASPDVQINNTGVLNDQLFQACGNNDGVIDPGERWSVALSATNSGAFTANKAYLALGKNRNSFDSDIGDDYGNQAASCERLFIDIENTGTLKTWDSAGFQGFGADDEGSALIQLDTGFDHYGQNITQLRASTNGYFSTSADAIGDDFSNDCPLPDAPDRDTAGARIAPMHTDLLGSAFYHQSFASCPRAAETGVDLACEVFLWKGADYYSSTDSTVEDVDVQAILYPATSQWVYQYGGSDLDAGRSTTGMQNASGTDGFSYACNTAGSINTNEAVCVFNKNAQPESASADFVVLETPLLDLGNVAPSQTANATLTFAIGEDASCGASFAINHEASVFDQGFNPGANNIISRSIGDGGSCDVVTSCGVGAAQPISNETNTITPRQGLWWNPDRDGNGFDLYTIARNSLAYFFYTGQADGEPIWYLANDNDSEHNQYYNNITTTNYPGGFGVGAANLSTVGWSNTTFIDDSTAIMVREIDGKLSAEKQFFFQYGPNETPRMHTGPYFTPSENGWGHSIGTLGNARVAISFIYDNNGNPYWTIGNGPNDDSAFNVFYNNTFCPSCPKTGTSPQVVGEIQMTLNGQRDGTLVKYNVDAENVDWDKSNLPLQIILVPEQE
ncbi:hypothetical protein OS175_01685 [Marinicella sp. S1101]|uniref:hypothetical protein n=1 Tax=Marinicella marina TaxID=2996016 RepID=UPI002260BAC1|nr:hypothetical protein [Marinicella marina]MCX7552574.1 hypothetical protein [Marinicella marina]MDJ1139450.1 hypothetical protein [Marinicella marina]